MKTRGFIAPTIALAAVIYLPKLALSQSSLYVSVLSPDRLAVLGAAWKLASLGAGAVFAGRAVKRLEPGNAARPTWLLFSLWLAGFAAGQAVLSTYEVILHKTPPLPSAGDALFLVGYAMMIVGLIGFIRVYRAAGFAIVSSREQIAFALAAALASSALAFPVLTPIAHTPQPMGEIAINLAYPILDFVALVPTVVLLRITLAFRGGKVWEIWATLLASIAFMAGGDILFGYLSSVGKRGIEPLVDFMFIAGYFLAACGAKLEVDLLTE